MTGVASVRAVMAAVGLALVACGGGAPSTSPPSSCPQATAVWVASDYASSAVGALSLSTATTAETGRADLGADPALARSQGRSFFVVRDQDAFFELDACGTPQKRFAAHVPGASSPSDPYGVAVAHDGSVWVALFLAARVLVLDPAGTVTATIDLSSYDGDHDPDASAITIVDTPAGEKAFVTLDRLNPYPRSVQPSWMLRIDVPTRKAEATVPLAGRNPFSVTTVGTDLWLAEPGKFDDASETDAGIERFDTATSTSTLVAREPALGGSVAEVAVTGACAGAIVADATTSNATSLVTLDPSTGAPLAIGAASPLHTAGFDLEGLAWVDGALLVGDRRRATDGYPVHAFSTPSSACRLTARPDVLFLPLPPIAIAPSQ